MNAHPRPLRAPLARRLVAAAAALGAAALVAACTPPPPAIAFPYAGLVPLDAAGAPPAIDKRALVVNFWASWCRPCRDEMPELERIAAEETRFTVVGVNLDRDVNLAREYLRRRPAALPAYRVVDPAAFAQAPVTALPQTWLVASDGRVLARITGARAWSEAGERRALHARLDAAGEP